MVAQGLEDDTGSDDAASLSGLGADFTSQLLSGVRFAPLVMLPVIYTVIPSNVWSPSIRRFYPDEHRCASMALLMCSNSAIVQPLSRVPTPDERFNAAAMLPKSIWLEILSYTHRRCKYCRTFWCIVTDRLHVVNSSRSLAFSLSLSLNPRRVCTGAK